MKLFCKTDYWQFKKTPYFQFYFDQFGEGDLFLLARLD